MMSIMAPLIAQPAATGALSTLYTATAPELAGVTPGSHAVHDCSCVMSVC